MIKIIAIWGWEIRENSTLKIDKEIIEISNKKNPKLLFIPTASSDFEAYCLGIKSYFTKLWCDVDVLYLIKEQLTIKEIEDKILNSDIIYVWGWNTLKMMTIWRKLWISEILKKAIQKDIVLSWLSAWAICWFKYWNSDSRKFTSNSSQLIKVSWLNFIKALCCPHYDTELHRQEDLKRMMKKSSLVAVALENNCAIEILDNKFRIIKSQENAKAYKIYWKKWEYFKQEILQKEDFLPIEYLESKN